MTMPQDKVISLQEMVARIPDGASLALGGSFLHRGPFAFVRELIRQEKRDLELIKQSPGYDVDILCRAGVLRVDSIADLFYMAEVLARQPRPEGRRLTVLTNAGGPGVLATDALVMGGGELAATLFEADLIDQVGVNIQPLLLGEGIPLFRPMRRLIELDLIRTEQLARGCVYALYRVQRPGP